MSKLIQEGLWNEGPEGPALNGSRCEDCGAKSFPARRVCPRCHSGRQTAARMSRRGKVYSYTRVFLKSPAIDECPYVVGYVLLEDGITVPARLKDGGEDFKIGAPVEMEVGPVGKDPGGEEVTGYFFRPGTGGESR